MEIQVLIEFQLKITLIGEAFTKKVILPQIMTIFTPSLDQIVYKIAKFEWIFNFFNFFKPREYKYWPSFSSKLP